MKKVALVTGGAQGIGLAICTRFAEAGYAIACLDIDETALAEARQRIVQQDTACLALTADVSNERAVEDAIQQTISEFGRLDVLVNNAGIGRSAPIEDLSLSDWDRVIGVNLRGTFLCTRFAVSHLEQTKGSVVNIASTRALMSEANTEAYSASKGGIVALTHALAVSLGPRGIRVNAISPGWIETANWQKSQVSRDPHHSDADRNQHPVGRVGEPMDIAQAAFYLAGDHSGFVTGQNLVIDGGMTIKMIYV